MNIEMILFDKKQLIPDGKYLVRTQSTSHLKTIQFLQARVKRSVNTKEGIVMSVDVSNQIVTHISKEPLNFD